MNYEYFPSVMKRTLPILFASSLLICVIGTEAAFAVEGTSAEHSTQAMSPQELLEKLEAGQKLQGPEVESLIAQSKAKPQDSKLHFVLGKYYETVNFGTLAAQEYEQAFNLDKKNAKALVALSRMQLRMGNEDASLTTIAKGVKLFPDDYDLLVTAGLMMQRRGDFKNADFIYQRAMKVGTPTAELFSARAELCFKQNRFADALDLANKALELNPDSFLAKAVRGKCLAIAGQTGRAIGPLRQAYEDMSVNQDMAVLYSETAIRAGNYKEALAPTLVAMPYFVGDKGRLMYYKKRVAGLITGLDPKDVSEGIRAAEKKFLNSKTAPMMFFCLGDVFDRLHRPAEALACYRKGLLRDPNYGRAHLRVGEDLEDHYGELEGALKEYQQALLLLPDDDEALLRYKRLKARMAHFNRDVAWHVKTAAKREKAKSLKPKIQIL